MSAYFESRAPADVQSGRSVRVRLVEHHAKGGSLRAGIRAHGRPRSRQGEEQSYRTKKRMFDTVR